MFELLKKARMTYRRKRDFRRYFASHDAPIDPGHKNRAWKLGFTPNTYNLYSSRGEDLSEYLNERDRVMRGGWLNGDHYRVLGNKILFEAQFGGLLRIPRNYGVWRGTYFVPFSRDEKERSIQSLFEWVASGDLKGIVIKPVDGEFGKGILILQRTQEGVLLNGKAITYDELSDELKNHKNSLVCEWVQQAEYSTSIFPGTTNSIRVLTLVDPETNEPFVAKAVHRFGTEISKPVDNFTKRGVCADIDAETGIMANGVMKSPEWRALDVDEHPDTGARITGVQVKNWKMMTEDLLHAMASFKGLNSVGWDVVTTEDAYEVIEGNSHSGVIVLQAQTGLLSNPRVRKFYEHHKVIRK